MSLRLVSYLCQLLKRTLQHEKHRYDLSQVLRLLPCASVKNDVTTKAMRVKTLETGVGLLRHKHNGG